MKLLLVISDIELVDLSIVVFEDFFTYGRNASSFKITKFYIYLNWPRNCQGRQFTGHFSLQNLVVMELPRLAILWPLLLGAEIWPSNCQGQQFESQRYQCAENWP